MTGYDLLRLPPVPSPPLTTLTPHASYPNLVPSPQLTTLTPHASDPNLVLTTLTPHASYPNLVLRCQRIPTCSESGGLRPSRARTSSCTPSDELSLGKAAVGKGGEGAAASPSTTISADLTSSADHSTIAEIRVKGHRVQGLVCGHPDANPQWDAVHSFISHRQSVNHADK